MLKIRPATVDDAALLRALIWELADFEKAPDEVRVTVEDLTRDGFGANPKFRALIAEWDGQPAGYALFFGYYSTWRGAGMYLEDVFVRPAFRGRGIGSALLAQVAHITRAENRILMKWDVLHWNQSAIDIYKAMGGQFMEEWCSVLLMGDDLQKLADKAL